MDKGENDDGEEKENEQGKVDRGRVREEKEIEWEGNRKGNEVKSYD